MPDSNDTPTDDRTYGEAVDDLLADVAEKLDDHRAAEAELEAADPETALERFAVNQTLSAIRERREALEESAKDLIETREQGPFERLTDDQQEQFRQMYGPHWPEDVFDPPEGNEDA